MTQIHAQCTGIGSGHAHQPRVLAVIVRDAAQTSGLRVVSPEAEPQWFQIVGSNVVAGPCPHCGAKATTPASTIVTRCDTALTARGAGHAFADVEVTS